ncbi:MAG TPA: hypothetical protein VN724_18115 [Pyrinomonadaceae bacterium]|nr:hypothetical protein [Pyrinomonadaceae bacterium]
MVTNLKIQIDYLRQGLVETMTWCELTPIGPPATRFRSSELKPEDGLYPAHHGFLLVETVCRRRAELLNEQNAQLVYEPAKGGRLLVFYPDLTLFDGAAELSSDGYFNSNNDPPWDTWVYFGKDLPSSEPEDHCRHFLLSWVPNSYLSTVQDGIDVNPEGCIEWLSDAAGRVPAELYRSDLLEADLG